MVKRKQKKYSRPRRMFDKARIEEENRLVKKYGLKNKREIWRAEAYVNLLRDQAKNTITKQEEQKELFNKLKKLGLNVENISDVLGLNKEDILKRRLQTILYNQKKAGSVNQARQLISHKHVKVGSKIVSSPSYIVKRKEEEHIEIK